MTKKIIKRYRKERIVRPRHEGGCDWGAERIVLVRKGEKELIWRKACKTWTGIVGGYQPEPAELSLYDFHRKTSGVPRDEILLHNKGGRLSMHLLYEHQTEIEEFFGEPVVDFIDTKRTLLLGRSR